MVKKHTSYSNRQLSKLTKDNRDRAHVFSSQHSTLWCQKKTSYHDFHPKSHLARPLTRTQAYNYTGTVTIEKVYKKLGQLSLFSFQVLQINLYNHPHYRTDVWTPFFTRCGINKNIYVVFSNLSFLYIRSTSKKNKIILLFPLVYYTSTSGIYSSMSQLERSSVQKVSRKTGYTSGGLASSFMVTLHRVNFWCLNLSGTLLVTCLRGYTSMWGRNHSINIYKRTYIKQNRISLFK